MRIQNHIPIFVACLLVPAPLNAQQSTPTVQRDPVAVSLLQKSLTALMGPTAVTDVTLSGTANWIAGSDNETGTATLKATAIGQGRIDLSLSNGQRSEVRDISANPSTGGWSGPDGTWQPITANNLSTEPAWFFPAFLMSRVLSSPGYAISPADAENRNSLAVEHFAVYQQFDASVPLSPFFQSLSRVDIYLNASNLLPVAITFNAHPDNDAGTNIPVEIDFSNYQSFQGAQVPYHIQKLINNGLVLDLTIQTVQTNNGLTSTDFQAQ